MSIDLIGQILRHFEFSFDVCIDGKIAPALLTLTICKYSHIT